MPLMLFDRAASCRRNHFMPSNIPCQRDLAIGQIVTEDTLSNLQHISALKAPVDAAKDQLNSLIALKRSIDMAAQEFKNMGIDPLSLVEEGERTDVQIKAAAENLGKIQTEVEKAIQPLLSVKEPGHYDVETPIDYHKSHIQQGPLFADSLRLSCEYIPILDNENSIITHGAAISSFVNETIAFGDDSLDSQINTTIQNQLNVAASKQSIAGTIVVSAVCAVKNAINIGPLVLDVDKAIHAWNTIFPKNTIQVEKVSELAKLASQMSEDREVSFKLITGATYASCFIGMIQIKDEPGSLTTEALRSLAQAIEFQFRAGSWIVMDNGSFGVDSRFLPDDKKLWSLLPATTCCSIISLGATSSVKSETLKQLNQRIQNTGVSFYDQERADIGRVEEKTVDVNTMKKALQEYVALCVENSNGIPVSYYLKPITKPQLAQMWFAKYNH